MTYYRGDQIRIKARFKDAAGAVKDISGSTSRQILVKFPNGQWVPFAATFSDDGEDGYAEIRTTGLKKGAVQKIRGRLFGMAEADPWTAGNSAITVEE